MRCGCASRILRVPSLLEASDVRILAVDVEIETQIIATEVRNNIAYIVLVETLLQVSRSRRVQAESMATNIFERMGSSWYLVSHHGSPLLR